MPEARVLRQELRLDALKDQILGTQLLYVRITRDLYAQNKDKDGPAVFVSSVPDIDLLIDPVDGFRLLRRDCDSDEARGRFDDAAAAAKEIHIPISHYAEQAPIIYDDFTKVIGVICGARAGKTHAMAYRLLRRWALRGGVGRRFWWVAPKWEQTEIGIDKIVGDGNSPPVFPPELVVYYPRDQYQTKQYIEIIDGTQVDLRIAHRKGGNLKGFSPMDIFVDELAEIAHRENWTVLVNRLTTNDGTICAVTTPIANHWSRADIVARAKTEDDVKHISISVFQNPWERESVINRLINTLGGHNDPVVRREFYGEWVASDRQLWPDWAPEKHLVVDRDIWDVEELLKAGYLPPHYRDVTARAVLRHFPESKNADMLLGQDFNLYPMSSSCIKVFGDPLDPKTWGCFIFDEVLTRGNIQSHCEELVEVYDGAPVAVDPSGAMRGTHSGQGARGSSTNCLEMRRFGFNAKSANFYKGKPGPIRQIDSISLCSRLMQAGGEDAMNATPRLLVSARCVKTIEAFENQERERDGRIAKVAGSPEDVLSGPTDAWRYAAWALFGHQLKNRVGRYDETQVEEGISF